MSAELTNMIDSMLRRLKRFGYLKDSIKFQDLLDRYDEDLFISMSKMHHCLHHLSPPARHLDSPRERGHPFSLPDFSTSIHKKSFVVHTLYFILCITIFRLLLYYSFQFILLPVYLCLRVFYYVICTDILTEPSLCCVRLSHFIIKFDFID